MNFGRTAEAEAAQRPRFSHRSKKSLDFARDHRKRV